MAEAGYQTVVGTTEIRVQRHGRKIRMSAGGAYITLSDNSAEDLADVLLDFVDDIRLGSNSEVTE